MREICEQCQRLIPSWRKPVLHENHIFCTQSCVEHHEIVEDSVHGALKPLECYQIPAPRNLGYIAGDVW